MRLVIILILTILTACTQGPSTAEQMYEHLEKAIELEENFAAQQEPLLELERKEKELYDEIIQKTSSEFEESVELSRQAIDIIHERRDIMDLEKESIEAAKEEFDKVTPLIEELDQEEAKETAEQMVEAMDQRYEAYLELYENYLQSLDLNEELYKMLQNEELTKEKLENQIEQVNESYDAIMAANETFNEFTRTYNDLKMKFYEQTELNIEMPEDEEEQEEQNEQE